MRFRYLASDATGKMQRGSLQATSKKEACAVLRTRGLMPLKLHASRQWTRVNVSLLNSSHLSPSDIALFSRQMATLLGSGVQIEQALMALENQSTRRLSAFCKELRQAVLEGASFSDALQANKAGFDRFFVSSVQAAERSGRYDNVLAHLAEHTEARLRNRQAISLAMIYPAVLILVSVAVVTGLLVYLLPDIVRVFASRGADLPPLTTAMIRLSDFLVANGLLLITAMMTMGASLGALSRWPEFRAWLHRVLWHVGLARQITIVQFTGTLATLTQSGVPLADALASASATVGNLEARRLLQETTQNVRDGVPLSKALPPRAGFPSTLHTMVASGETSGKLPEMLHRFAEDQSQSLQARVKALVGLVEPLVLLFMGGVVMLLVLAILLPIVNLNSLVG